MGCWAEAALEYQQIDEEWMIITINIYFFLLAKAQNKTTIKHMGNVGYVGSFL